METRIENYLFKLDRIAGLIEVYGDSALKPMAFIRVNSDISEKKFQIEASYWVMENNEF